MTKILIVEDDFYIRDIYKEAFEEKGYQVFEAGNGKGALGLIEQENFEFVILDLMLPDFSGIEVFKKIKKVKNMPVYVLTNVGDEKIVREIMRESPSGFFRKVNYNPEQLVREIEKKQQELKAA